MLAGGGGSNSKDGGICTGAEALPLHSFLGPTSSVCQQERGGLEVEQVVTSGRPAGGRLSAQAGLLEAGECPRWGVLNLALGDGINHQGPGYFSLPLSTSCHPP